MEHSIETEIDCPFCGETISVLIDPSEPHQNYIEDCSVCCRPIQINVTCSDEQIESLSVDRS